MKNLNDIKRYIRFTRRNGIGAMMRMVMRKVRREQNPAARALSRKYEDYLAMAPSDYEKALCDWYMYKTEDELDLAHPKNLHEKIQWLKLYDSTPLKTKLADKLAVRPFIREKLGEGVLVPVLGEWDAFDEIDFSALPDRFVLKANHGSRFNEIVPDKSQIDMEALREKCDRWLSIVYAFACGFEMHYLNIRPKLFAEPFIGNGDRVPDDYKVTCINGKIVYICVQTLGDDGRWRCGYFDRNWMPIEMAMKGETVTHDIPKPDCLEELIGSAEKLAEEFALVRCDFYIVDGNELRFGEMTFTPASGVSLIKPEKLQRKFGNMLVLPQKSPIPVRIVEE